MSGFERILYDTITFQKLENWLEQGEDMKIIDLRDPVSYKDSHFKTAINLPYEDIDEWITDLPWGELLVFYCSRGSTSMIVCNRLSAAGYTVINVAGGYRFYKGRYREKND